MIITDHCLVMITFEIVNSMSAVLNGHLTVST